MEADQAHASAGDRSSAWRELQRDGDTVKCVRGVVGRRHAGVDRGTGRLDLIGGSVRSSLVLPTILAILQREAAGWRERQRGNIRRRTAIELEVRQDQVAAVGVVVARRE